MRHLSSGKTRYRDHMDIVRAALEAILNSKRPMTEWRLFYVLRAGGSQRLSTMIEEMCEYKLIKKVSTDSIRRGPPRKYGELGNIMPSKTSKYLEITPKGQKLLKIMNEMTELIPLAPWLERNNE